MAKRQKHLRETSAGNTEEAEGRGKEGASPETQRATRPRRTTPSEATVCTASRRWSLCRTTA